MDFFKKLFGFSGNSFAPDEANRPDIFPQDPSDNNEFNFSQPSSSHNNLEEHINRNFHDEDAVLRNFNMFTDPLEMHKYFEQQMESLFKNFGLSNFFHALDGPEFKIDRFDDQDDEQNDKQKSFNPRSRDNFLRSKLIDDEPSSEKIDKDLDGKISLDEIGKFLKDPSAKSNNNNNNKQLIFPDTVTPFGNKRFFNQSVQVKTVTKPDGSIESRKIVRDSEGNEETTITQKFGDKEYTIIKKRDKNGKEEVHENMININDEEKGDFYNNKRFPMKPNNFYDSLFGNFFK